MKNVATKHGQFASDNYSGICPEAWEFMQQANTGHVRSYGDDPWTEMATNSIREIFETDCEVFFVFNGTAANSLSLASLCQSYHSILCSDVAHVETDECGAPEFFSNGTKMLLIPGQNGKVQPEAIEQMVKRRTDIHFPKPRVLSLTQATELGTVYSPKELLAIKEVANKLNLKIHMDGARFANAVAGLNLSPAEITWKAGVDVLCFGGTKNGIAIGEAVVFFKKELAYEFDYRCKQAGQLASKMRFLAAPWVGMLTGGVWLKYARHANAMASYLEEQLSKKTIMPMFPREANSVFVTLPEAAQAHLRGKGWLFYSFIGKGGCRLMCSWDTTREDIDSFLTDLDECIFHHQNKHEH
ncbi:MAG: ltaE [Verrucomicrobiales bacterium]|nr:ltaE [Verrucomicrobiales bacterium]